MSGLGSTAAHSPSSPFPFFLMFISFPITLLLCVRLVPQVLLEMAPVPVMIWQGCHHCPSHLSSLVLLHFPIAVRTSIPDSLSAFTRRVKAPTVGQDFKNGAVMRPKTVGGGSPLATLHCSSTSRVLAQGFQTSMCGITEHCVLEVELQWLNTCPANAESWVYPQSPLGVALQ